MVAALLAVLGFLGAVPASAQTLNWWYDTNVCSQDPDISQNFGEGQFCGGLDFCWTSSMSDDQRHQMWKEQNRKLSVASWSASLVEKLGTCGDWLHAPTWCYTFSEAESQKLWAGECAIGLDCWGSFGGGKQIAVQLDAACSVVTPAPSAAPSASPTAAPTVAPATPAPTSTPAPTTRVCTCRNGIQATGPDCAEDGGETCASCHQGYEFSLIFSGTCTSSMTSHCHSPSSDLPCLPSWQLIGAGVDITKVDLYSPLDAASRRQAAELSLQGRHPVVDGQAYQTPIQVRFRDLNEDMTASSLKEYTSNVQLSEELSADMQVEGSTAKVSAGASSSFAADLTTSLQTGTKTMLMTSRIRLAHVLIDTSTIASEPLLDFLSTYDVAHIEGHFAQTFGTHYIDGLFLGGRVESLVTMSECVASQHNSQDIQAAAEFEVASGLKSSSGEASGSESLSSSQQQALSHMSFKHYRLGGDGQYVEDDAFSQAEWGSSVTIENCQPIEVTLKDYDTLLIGDARIPTEKRDAALASISAWLTENSVDLVELSACDDPDDEIPEVSVANFLHASLSLFAGLSLLV